MPFLQTFSGQHIQKYVTKYGSLPGQTSNKDVKIIFSQWHASQDISLCVEQIWRLLLDQPQFRGFLLHTSTEETRRGSDEAEHFIDSVSEERQEAAAGAAVIISWAGEAAILALNQQLDSFIIAIRASFRTPKRQTLVTQKL